MEDTGLIQYGTHKSPAFFSLISSNDSEFWKRSAKPVYFSYELVSDSVQTLTSLPQFYRMNPS